MAVTVRLTTANCTSNANYTDNPELGMISVLANAGRTAAQGGGFNAGIWEAADATGYTTDAAGNRVPSGLQSGVRTSLITSLNAVCAAEQGLILRVIWGTDAPTWGQWATVAVKSTDPHSYGAARDVPNILDPAMSAAYKQSLVLLNNFLEEECDGVGPYDAGHTRATHVHNVPIARGGLEFSEMAFTYGSNFKVAGIEEFNEAAWLTATGYQDAALAAQIIAVWEQGAKDHADVLTSARMSLACGDVLRQWSSVEAMIRRLGKAYGRIDDRAKSKVVVMNTNLGRAYCGGENRKALLAAAYQTGCLVGFQTQGTVQQGWSTTDGDTDQERLAYNSAKGFVRGCEHAITGVTGTPVNPTSEPPVGPDGTQFQELGEAQKITVTATGGVFTVTFDGEGPTASVAFDASASTLKTAMVGLANIDSNDLTITKVGSVFTLQFAGQYTDEDVPLVTLGVASLTGGSAVASQVAPPSWLLSPYGVPEYIEIATGVLAKGAMTLEPVGGSAGWPHAGSFTAKQYLLTNADSVQNRTATFTPWEPGDTPPPSSSDLSGWRGGAYARAM